jgi:hypothetical protein
MRDQQAMAGAIEVLDLDMGRFGQAQAPAIDATQERASPEVALGADAQELGDFAHAIDPGRTGGAAGALDAMEQRFDVLLQELAVEGAHRVDGQVDGGRSLLALGN